MCGIAGVIQREYMDPGVLAEMGTSIRHRGPDDDGDWRGKTSDGHVALLHRRLSIIGLEDGHQPMSTADGHHTVVYNGEIYNFPKLRKQLEGEGVGFQTHCDTEVLLHLYRKYGEDMVHHLRGMFAFAIWDSNDQSLFIARDHLGQKPLFFYHDPQRRIFAFASEIKALLASRLVEQSINYDGLWHHTGLRFCPGDSTLIAGVKKLGPAQCGRYRPDNGSLAIKRYWTIDYREKHVWTFDETLARLENILEESVEAHLLSDVPTGSFLSGGIDSSTVAALAVKHTGSDWPTFSIGVGDKDFSELPAARMAAETIGTNHMEQQVDPDLFLSLPDVLWHLEEPGDPHAIGIWCLSNMASNHVKVALGGDGGDEAFGGYTRFARSRLLDIYSAIPKALRVHVTGPLIDLLPASFSYYSFASKAHWAHEMSLRSGAARQAHALTYFRFTEEERRKLFTPEFLENVQQDDTDRFIAEYHNSEVCETDLDRLMYTEQMTRMAEHDLRIADRMAMAHSLELRAPIMDREVIEFAAKIPADYKIKHGRLKMILRELCRKYYPDEFVDRAKYGFGFPMARWFAGPLAGLVQQVIDEGEIFSTGILRRERVQEIFDEHRNRRTDHNFKIWNIINMEVWHRLFITHHQRSDIRDWLNRSGHGPLTGSAAK